MHTGMSLHDRTLSVSREVHIHSYTEFPFQAVSCFTQAQTNALLPSVGFFCLYLDRWVPLRLFSYL